MLKRERESTVQSGHPPHVGKTGISFCMEQQADCITLPAALTKCDEFSAREWERRAMFGWLVGTHPTANKMHSGV
jgi:hypothetical protein